jgi:cytochrome c oxidase subunit 2
MFVGPANTTGKVDSAFLFIVACCVVLLMIITVSMLYFLGRYNKTKNPASKPARESVLLEVAWTVIPTILVVFMFYFGYVDFEYIRNAPADSMKIHVLGRQWSWHFTYANGKQSAILRVPEGKDVELLMTSADVIHSFYIPAFRIKEDCVPGMQTHLWFNADRQGPYDVFCTEYCGVGHSHMRTKVIVMPPEEFQKWYLAAEERGPGQEAMKLLESKGCLGCHTLDGTAKVGPTFKRLFGSRVTVTTNGKDRTLNVNAAYLERSIKQPQADLVKGYMPVMPTLPMTENEIKTIVDYLQTVK